MKHQEGNLSKPNLLKSKKYIECWLRNKDKREKNWDINIREANQLEKMKPMDILKKLKLNWGAHLKEHLQNHWFIMMMNKLREFIVSP